MRALTYLDNGATSFPKPASVYRELDRCVRTYCGNAGRSSHSLSVAAAEKIYECRSVIAKLVGLSKPERVVFTYNTTHAINTALYGVLKHGDHVITGKTEHNAVMRPLKAMEKEGMITLSQVDTSNTDELIRRLSVLINPKTRAIVLSHASNVLPLVLDMGKIGALCRSRGVLFIADCAQSAGLHSIDMEKDKIDIVCLPSHKGLLGIQGAGALCIGEGVDEKRIKPVFQGGNGVMSQSYFMSELLPERLEAGTLSTPAIASLCEGAKYVLKVGTESILSSVSALADSAFERLSSIKAITVYSIPNGAEYKSSVLFNLNGIPSETLAMELDKRSVCVRGGLHCAPDAHRYIGTQHNGALRASFGIFNTASDVEKLYSSVKDIAFKGL